MPSIFLYGLAAFGILIFFGVPAIMMNIKLRRKLDFVEINIDSDQALDREFFRKIDLFASRRGYTREMDVSVEGLSGRNYNRLYSNTDGSALLVTQMFAQDGDKTKYFEFNSRYDEVEVNVNNAQVSSLFARPPWIRLTQRPEIDDPEELLSIHRLECAKYGRGALRRVRKEQFAEVFQKDHIRNMDYQVSQGILRLDPAGENYSPTLKLATLGVVNYLNPAKDNFSWNRFLRGYVAAVAATAVGWASYFDGAAWLEEAAWVASPQEAVTASVAVMGLAYALAGVFIGHNFGPKSFLWSILAVVPAFAALSLSGMILPEAEHIYLAPALITVRSATAVYLYLFNPDSRLQAVFHVFEVVALVTIFTGVYGWLDAMEAF